ncbi:MAG: thiamine-phosphate kinase [Acidobacteriota bacterium]
MAANEDRLLRWLRRRLDGGPEHPRPGDDGAVLPAGPESTVSVDSQIAGVHFPPDLDPRLLGQRLTAVNLSDLAAMGAEPRYAFVTVAAPRDFDHRRFFTGLLAACERYGLVLAGGDLAHQPDRVITTMTVTGERRGKWLERANGRAGDRLWLGGSVGESALGRKLIETGGWLAPRSCRLPTDLQLSRSEAAAAKRAIRRHLQPTPQLDLGRALAAMPFPIAAIDLSDGLLLDLERLCRESRVGAEIDISRIPLAASSDRLAAKLDLDEVELALGGGEDYVLLFTLPAGATPPRKFRCSPIGRLIARRGLFRKGEKGPRPLTAVGWDHL